MAASVFQFGDLTFTVTEDQTTLIAVSRPNPDKPSGRDIFHLKGEVKNGEYLLRMFNTGRLVYAAPSYKAAIRMLAFNLTR